MNENYRLPSRGHCARLSTYIQNFSTPVVSRVMRRCQKMRHSCQSIQKSSIQVDGAFQCWHYLSSRAVTRQVLSALVSLTSVFGMGTGGPSQQSIPTHMDGSSPSFIVKSLPASNRFILAHPVLPVNCFLRTAGDPYRIRTDVKGVRGLCLNHLTNGPWCTFTDSNRGPTD